MITNTTIMISKNETDNPIANPFPDRIAIVSTVVLFFIAKNVL